MLLNRAYRVLQNSDVSQCRLVFKGYNKRLLTTATMYIDDTFTGIKFIRFVLSIGPILLFERNENRVEGQCCDRVCSIFQQFDSDIILISISLLNPPRHGMTPTSTTLPSTPPPPSPQCNGPDQEAWLNVLFLDKPAPGAGIKVKETGAKVGRYGFVLGKGVAKKNRQTSNALQDLNSVLDTK
eukprot:sb/3471548/